MNNEPEDPLPLEEFDREWKWTLFWLVIFFFVFVPFFAIAFSIKFYV
jgi:hypothetical protein